MIRRPLLAFVSILLFAARAAGAQETVTLPDPGAAPIGEARLVARLPVPAGIRAASGALSPDGERYVYGAMADSAIQLWMLELRTRELRLTTPGPGRRHDPVWSPDGTRVAYWRADGLGGIYVLDVAQGREHRVWADTSQDVFVATPRWAGNDSLIFTRAYLVSIAGGPDPLWIVGADGGPGREIARPDARARLREDDERGTPYFGSCCGGARTGLWIQPTGPDAAARCVAGPLDSHREAVWTGPPNLVAFAARARGRDTLLDLWAADPARGGARRVRAPGNVGALSASRAGDVALLVHPAPGQQSELWIIPAGRLRGDARGDTLAACPGPPPEIGAFLRAQGVPAIRSVTVLFEEPRERLAFFHVTYGREVDWGVYESGRGLAYEGRVGWIAPAQDMEVGEPVGGEFDLRAEDEYLFSRPFLARLAGTDVGRTWIAVLLADADTPDRVVGMLTDSAVRTNDVALAQRLFGSRRVRADHRRLIRLGEIPWPHGANPAEGLLVPLALAVIADPRSPEPVLFRLAERLPGPHGVGSDTLYKAVARALAASPVARRSARIQQRLALLWGSADEPAAIRRAATERLLAHPQATDSLLHPVVQQLARDSAAAPRLLDEPAVRRSAWLTAQLASPYTRTDVRVRARERVLADSAASEDALASLAWMVMEPWDDSVAVVERILSHPGMRGNGAVLASLVAVEARRPWRTAPPPGRVEALLAAVLRDPRTDERELYRIAVELQSSDATRAAALLLENPRARRCAPVLHQIAEMMVFKYEPPQGPHVADPPAPVVKARAAELLTGLNAAGPPPCDVRP